MQCVISPRRICTHLKQYTQNVTEIIVDKDTQHSSAVALFSVPNMNK